MKKAMAAQKIRSRTGLYDKIIQVNVPVRFYWAEGEFDGIEFGPFERPVPRYQIRLVYQALDALAERMDTEPILSESRKSDSDSASIPQVFLDAFKRESSQ